MKKISTLICLILFSLVASSQIPKGTKFVGGIFSAGSSKTESALSKESATTISFSPSVGKFYRENRLYGVDISLGHTFRKDRPDDVTYGGGIFFRQYKALGKTPVLLFLHEEVSYLYSKSHYIAGTNPPYTQKTTSNTFSLLLSPGAAYPISRRLQAELTIPSLINLAYVSGKYEYGDAGAADQEFNYLGLSTGFSNSPLGDLSFGLRWFIY